MQLTPVQQQAQLIAAKERERADNSRFASNLVYSRSADPPQQQQQGQTMPTQYGPAERQTNSSLVSPPAEGKQDDTPGGYKRPLEANIDSAVGQPYLVYEGSVLDTVLMNRLDGDAVGPVKVLVSNPLYSHDHQHVIIPDGTMVLGEAKKIGAAGFGQQRRMAVVFHRLIMPDGYSVDLDQFQGLDQIGEEGLKDKVNNHYFQIFGTSIALGVIAGASQITQGGGTITSSGSQGFTNGAAASVSQSAATILDRFIQIPPTITIRETIRLVSSIDELEVLGVNRAEQQDIEDTLHAQEILDRMDEWSRKVWVAREYGYSWKHIGRVLGIPGDSVMLRFRRRMKILRARLSGGR